MKTTSALRFVLIASSCATALSAWGGVLDVTVRGLIEVDYNGGIHSGSMTIVSQISDFNFTGAALSTSGLSLNANPGAFLWSDGILGAPANVSGTWFTGEESYIPLQGTGTITGSFTQVSSGSASAVYDTILRYQGTLTAAPVPEPASMTVLGLGGLCLARRRKV